MEFDYNPNVRHMLRCGHGPDAWHRSDPLPVATAGRPWEWYRNNSNSIQGPTQSTGAFAALRFGMRSEVKALEEDTLQPPTASSFFR